MGNEVLHLPLKSGFYLMIELGSKREEYREITPYWIARLVNRHFVDLLKISNEDAWQEKRYDESFVKELETYITLNGADVVINDFDSVLFSYGYTKRRIKCKTGKLRIDYGKTEWGAEEGKKYFVIPLEGRIL